MEILYKILAISLVFSSGETKREEDRLLPSAVSEGPCKQFTTSVSLSNFASTLQRTWYVPMASQFLYRSYVQVFLKRSAKTQEEVDDLKLKVKCSAIGCIHSSNGKELHTICLPSTLSIGNTAFDVTNCNATDIINISNDVKVASLASQTSYIMAQNREKFILYGLCINGEEKAWALYTEKPKVSDKIRSQVEKVLMENGFDTDYYGSLNYPSKGKKEE